MATLVCLSAKLTLWSKGWFRFIAFNQHYNEVSRNQYLELDLIQRKWPIVVEPNLQI